MSTNNLPAHSQARFSLRYKLLIGFTLVFTVVFAGAFFWFYKYSTDSALERIRADLGDTLVGTISGINGDDFEAMVKEAKVDETGVPSTDPRYIAHQHWIDQINQIEPRAYATYTYVKGSQPDQILWVGDSYRIDDPPNSTKWLEPYTRTPDSYILEGFTNISNRMNFHNDPWGHWVSAYGPIKNSKGEIVGAVGIDFLADYVIQVQRGITQILVSAFILTYIAFFILVYFISNFLTAPMIRLANAAKNIGEGDYSQDLSSLTHSGRSSDEIDTLAENFAIMVGKVYQREQTLRMEVAQLRIEIDRTRQQSEVDQIVDTDFFKDLQNKARNMRGRASRTSEAPA